MNESQLDLKNTTPIKGFNEGQLFGQGFILRRVSKFISGGSEDSILPIPIFYDLESKKILPQTLPPDLREEYRDISL